MSRTARRWPGISAGRRSLTSPCQPTSGRSRVEDLISRARRGDAKARAAIQATGRYLGAGLVSVVNVFDPTRVYVGGEITAAWDLIEGDVRAAFAERALTPAAAATEIRPVATSEESAPAGRGGARDGAGVCRAGRGVARERQTSSPVEPVVNMSGDRSGEANVGGSDS